MGHVDDAHQAIGDRQAERGEQQDRAEAQSGERRQADLRAEQAAVDFGERQLRRAAHALVRFRVGAVAALRDERGEHLPHLRVVALREVGGGLGPQRRIRVLQCEGRGRQFQHALDLGVGLLVDRLLHDGQQALVVRALQRLRGGEARRRVRAREFQRRERGVDLAAQPVVDHERLEARGRRAERGTGRGVGHLAVGDDDRTTAVVDQAERFIRQRAQDVGDARLLGRGELADGLDAHVRILVGERQHAGGVERSPGRRDEERQGEREEAKRLEHGIPERRSGRPPFQGKAPAPVLQDQTGESGFFSLPAMNGLHGWARMGPLVRHTTLNCPSARTSPMSTGLCRWWFFSSIFSL